MHTYEALIYGYSIDEIATEGVGSKIRNILDSLIEKTKSVILKIIKLIKSKISTLRRKKSELEPEFSTEDDLVRKDPNKTPYVSSKVKSYTAQLTDYLRKLRPFLTSSNKIWNLIMDGKADLDNLSEEYNMVKDLAEKCVVAANDIDSRYMSHKDYDGVINTLTETASTLEKTIESFDQIRSYQKEILNYSSDEQFKTVQKYATLTCNLVIMVSNSLNSLINNIQD